MKAAKISKQQPNTSAASKASPLATGPNNPVQQQRQNLADESPQVSQLKAYQRMADDYSASLPQLGTSQSTQPVQKKELTSSPGLQLAFAAKARKASGPVAQLVHLVSIPSYSGQKVDIDDPKVIEALIEALEDEDIGPEIIDEVKGMPEVVEAVNAVKSGLFESQEDPNIRLKAEADQGGWVMHEGETPEEKKESLFGAIVEARRIIPQAFNRNEEVGKGNGPDYINTAYAVKDALVGEYARDLIRGGIVVNNKYIHPAALERLYAIVRETTPKEKTDGNVLMVGVCKDFASLVYGLILQNDRSGSFKPRLTLMQGHVYVEVTIDGKPYAVDAWIGGKVLPKAEHEQLVNAKHSSIKILPPDLQESKGAKEPTEEERQAQFAKVRTKKEEASYNQSLKASYDNADKAKLIWYQNEAKYRKIAIEKWAEGKMENENRGSM